MKLEELLKAQGLSEEQISAVIKGMKDNKIHITSLENADERYQKLKSQKEDVEGQLKTANDTITDLKKSNKDNETLQTKISEYEGKVTEYEKKIADMQFSNALDNALKDANVKNTKAVKALLDMDKIKYDNDTLIGVKEQLDSIKETDAYLFNTGEVKAPYSPVDGGSPKGDLASLMKSKDFNLTKYLSEQNQ
ncbi:MAG: phage scaffolding protein [Clostridium sp.]